MIDLLGKGIYSFSEAARLAHVSPRRARAWYTGWPRGAGHVIVSDYEATPLADGVVSFLDLVDLLVVSRLRDQHGLSLNYLRHVYAALRTESAQAHPFCRRDVLLNSATREVFLHVADSVGESGQLREVVSRQQAFPEILLPCLEQIVFEEQTQLASMWEIYQGVLVDPMRAYGKPILKSTAVPTSVLAAAFFANQKDADIVADWYRVDPEDVLQAVSFEQSLGGKAA